MGIVQSLVLGSVAGCTLGASGTRLSSSKQKNSSKSLQDTVIDNMVTLLLDSPAPGLIGASKAGQCREMRLAGWLLRRPPCKQTMAGRPIVCVSGPVSLLPRRACGDSS
ncbi:hypothetical protein V8C44DRAFT_330462 [Trichoderma aethiopicum]